MRVVSLNLDHGDATVVRRAIRQALDACTCADDPDQYLCRDCQALAATLVELNRLVHRPTLGRTPLLTLVAANGRHHTEPSPDEGSPRFGPDPEFRLLVGDGGNR